MLIVVGNRPVRRRFRRIHGRGRRPPRYAAAPGRTVRGPAGVRGRRAKPHDHKDDRISNGGRNETRALILMPTLRVSARGRAGDASRPLCRAFQPTFHDCGKTNCVPFTLNGLDVTTGAASNCSMGQFYSSERCKHCGGLMVLVMPVDGSGPGALRCWECDRIDPLELPAITAWLVGELRPPK